MEILFICGALAAGEYAASLVPTLAEAWPLVAALAALVVLFGHGLAVRGWAIAAVFLLGAALFLRASVEGERLYRERPWLRGQRRHERQGAAPLGAVASAVKCDLSRRVALGLGHDRETVSLNRAILLGERSRLPWRTKRVFVNSGTMHVFAISGLHVMAVAGVLVFLLSFSFLPRRLAGAAAIPILWGYVHLIGWTPSGVRAALMATLCFLAPVFWRRPNLLRAWALTFLLVHLFRPLMVANVGNALSFAVMLAIALAAEHGRRCGKRIRSGWIVVIAWAAGVPIGAHVFGQVAPGGMLANLVLVTAAEFTVATGAVGVIVSFVSEALASHLNNLSALCTRAMVGVSEAVSRLPGSCFEVPCWTLLQCAGWYASFAALALFLARFRSRKAL